MRRKRWKAPNDPTAAAKQVWQACYPERSWPRGWTVQWVGFMRGAMGLCDYGSRRVLLSYGDAKRRPGEIVQTLVHEFVHVINGHELRHGLEFDRLTAQALARIGIAMPRWNGSRRGLKRRELEAA